MEVAVEVKTIPVPVATAKAGTTVRKKDPVECPRIRTWLRDGSGTKRYGDLIYTRSKLAVCWDFVRNDRLNTDSRNDCIIHASESRPLCCRVDSLGHQVAAGRAEEGSATERSAQAGDPVRVDRGSPNGHFGWYRTTKVYRSRLRPNCKR